MGGGTRIRHMGDAPSPAAGRELGMAVSGLRMRWFGVEVSVAGRPPCPSSGGVNA